MIMKTESGYKIAPSMRYQCTDFDYHPRTYLADFVLSGGCLLPLSLMPHDLVLIFLVFLFAL